MHLLDDLTDKPRLAFRIQKRYDENLERSYEQLVEISRLCREKCELWEKNRVLENKSQTLENENASLREELAALRTSRQDEGTTDVSDDTKDLVHVEERGDDDLLCDSSPAHSISSPSSTAQELPDTQAHSPPAASFVLDDEPSSPASSFVLVDELSSPACSSTTIAELGISDAAPVTPGAPCPSHVAIPTGSLESDSNYPQNEVRRVYCSALELELGMSLYNHVGTTESPVPSEVDDTDVRPTEWISEDEELREGCIEMHYGTSYRSPLPELPGVLTYGIQYRPDAVVRYPDEAALDVPSSDLRTVTISNIPAGHQLRDVLQRVRGGGVHKAILADTRALGQGMTAMVKFISADDASNFVGAAQELATPKRAADIAYPWKVTLTGTPAYPDHTFVTDAIEEEGATRCLMVRGASIDDMLELLSGLGLDFRRAPHKVSVLEDAFIDHKGRLFLNFADIAVAVNARHTIRVTERLSDINQRISYAMDHCQGCVCELAKPSEPVSCGYMSFKDISLHCNILTIITFRQSMKGYLNTFTVKALDPNDHGSKRLYHMHALPWTEDQMKSLKAKVSCDACKAGEQCDQHESPPHWGEGTAFFSLEEHDMLHHLIVAPGTDIWHYCDSQ
ncbi:uncharacterized protein E0L32_003804 [Thyridium curvatum]|uniref:Uncharacterized protein n=1 Tax=Thyridium curvatum TaxID=1093900 RepID=A0A507BIU2_9PEZI|nr:uncharacterized protein E0L32_003804 [Thyridium curvatum]TPX16510.1 hypothetical protein E0L32_003804 [Thyridium curvatum]